MFEKKFRVRIRHSCAYPPCKPKLEDWYYIEYAHYRIFPRWRYIYNWIAVGKGCWNPVMLSYVEAKKFAQRFKSVENVQVFHKEQEDQRVEYFKSEEYRQSTIYTPHSEYID